MSTLMERAMAKVDKGGPGGCWIWTASRCQGYGQINVGGKPRRAHRVVYELHRGTIPDGLQLDHLCRVRACVNPAHLEPVTNRENTMRGDLPDMTRARMRSKTQCKNGHPLSGDNVRVTPDGRRRCRACGRARSRRHLGERPTSRRRGPLRDVVQHQGRRSILACGHELTRRSGNRPNQLRCDACDEELNRRTYSDNPPGGSDG